VQQEPSVSGERLPEIVALDRIRHAAHRNPDH
jgi:hypothetical protein